MDLQASKHVGSPSCDETPNLHLHKIVKKNGDQNLYRCQGCGSCNKKLNEQDTDIGLDSLIKMILQNDEEVLTSRTLWSDEVLDSIQYACQKGIDLRAVFIALRAEAENRDLIKETKE